MKKIILIPIVVLLLIFYNCEKVIDVTVPSIEPKIVIDATFDVFFNEKPITADIVVKLNLSSDYFEDEATAVTNANVFLTNLSDDSIINFEDVEKNGNYKPTDPDFIPKDDVEYELTVVYNKQTYKGKATKVKSTTFKNVEQKDEKLFKGNIATLNIAFKDPKDIHNSYLFYFDKSRYLAIEDEFFDGSDYNFSFFYTDTDIKKLPETVNLKMSAITKEYYTYFIVLLDQSNPNSGGPFQTTPSSLLGNIVNTTNDSNFPLGYFHISETDTYSIKLIEK